MHALVSNSLHIEVEGEFYLCECEHPIGVARALEDVSRLVRIEKIIYFFGIWDVGTCPTNPE